MLNAPFAILLSYLVHRRGVFNVFECGACRTPELVFIRRWTHPGFNSGASPSMARSSHQPRSTRWSSELFSGLV